MLVFTDMYPLTNLTATSDTTDGGDVSVLEELLFGLL